LAGKGAKIVAFLCRNHHEKITLHQWREGVYTHPDGSKRYYVQNQKGEEQMPERIIEAAPTAITTSSPSTAPVYAEMDAFDEATKFKPSLPAVKEETDLSQYSDEQLATLFHEGDKQQAEGFLLKCKVVQAYRERHVQAWGESWLENAYELFHVSRRTLFAYANIGLLCDKADTYLVENIAPLTSSKSLMTHIGRKSLEDGKVALEAAVTHLAELGEPPTVAALQHRLGEEKEPVCPDVCPSYGDGKHRFICACGKER